MQRSAKRRRADDLTTFQWVEQIIPFKGFKPGPEPDKRRLRLLGLEANKVLDRCLHGNIFPCQQHLPGKQGSIEPSSIEDLGGHARLAWSSFSRLRLNGPVRSRGASGIARNESNLIACPRGILGDRPCSI